MIFPMFRIHLHPFIKLYQKTGYQFFSHLFIDYLIFNVVFIVWIQILVRTSQWNIFHIALQAKIDEPYTLQCFCKCFCRIIRNFITSRRNIKKFLLPYWIWLLFCCYFVHFLISSRKCTDCIK